jgi:hypothetical protein
MALSIDVREAPSPSPDTPRHRSWFLWKIAGAVVLIVAGVAGGVVASDADWVLNLRAAPAQEVRIGCDRYAPTHRFLTEDEAVAAAVAFRHQHPRRLRLLSTILGWGDLSADAAVCEFVRSHRFVALRPAYHPAHHIEER